jgi:hypothetical protein
LNVPPDVIVQHTPSGWTNQQIMLTGLESPSTQVNDVPILLILDVYPAHRAFSLVERAREPGVPLLFVPLAEDWDSNHWTSECLES